MYVRTYVCAFLYSLNAYLSHFGYSWKQPQFSVSGNNENIKSMNGMNCIWMHTVGELVIRVEWRQP